MNLIAWGSPLMSFGDATRRERLKFKSLKGTLGELRKRAKNKGKRRGKTLKLWSNSGRRSGATQRSTKARSLVSWKSHRSRPRPTQTQQPLQLNAPLCRPGRSRTWSLRFRNCNANSPPSKSSTRTSTTSWVPPSSWSMSSTKHFKRLNSRRTLRKRATFQL